jgi:cytochrome c-type biogenesis protein CcmH
MRQTLFALAALMMMAATPVPQPADDRPLPEASQEQRAQDLHRSLRCVVCQNESIAESNAVLAADLRQVVRERVAAGDTDEEVRDYMVARYGDFVLLKPPFEVDTWILWFGPFAVVLIGAAAIVAYLRRRRVQPEAQPLTAAEKKRLDALLDSEGDR